MKNFKILILILNVYINNIHGAVWFKASGIKTVCSKRECVEYCDLDDYFLKPGESINSENCTAVYCNSDFSSSGHSCGYANVIGLKNEKIKTKVEELLLKALPAIFQEVYYKTKICKNGQCEYFCDLGENKLKPGESLKMEDCTEIICNEDFTTTQNSCSVAITADGCVLSPDFTLIYPQCCNKLCLSTKKIV
ncbi:hypothetical protein PVAND_011925 [Polypedilum vanderplanki]|uniref:Single domain-containing protein n=1 Tax=Polypedilum vanderplanki TaxID=319348 RepID=A0A9J6CKS3_POLVA|nr:hypothetical protein PVAND_011925 [Polypedilum vanderplanki]